MFGFAGTHRSGKTTLAKACAEALNLPYHDASVSKIARELGVESVDKLPMDKRVEVQMHILRRYVEGIKAAARPCITDRTPLDFIGYMLGEVTMHNTDPTLGKHIYEYVDLCLKATATHFDTVIFVPPLDTYAANPTKPPESLAYQRLVQFIVDGSVHQIDHRITHARLFVSDLKTRITESTELIADRLQKLAEQRQVLRPH